ncbi:MAG: threonine dehydratase [Alphaproteobacteria bacterium]|nr:threonine dehydratase [Alphaproteobacteria bacterium]
MFSLAELDAAAAEVHAVIPPTPQHRWALLSERVGAEVFVKHENHTPLGAFKCRGGVTYLNRLKKREPNTPGVVSASSGNHGQSLAYSAKRLGMRAMIVIGETSNPEKRASMAALGAELVDQGATTEDKIALAQKLGSNAGLHFVPPWHPDLVIGVASYGLELLRGVPDLDTVYVPIGLGSGACGVIAARDALGLKTKVVGVVSANANAYEISWEAGKVIDKPGRTVAEGLEIASPHPEAFKWLKRGLERIVSVSEEEILDGIRILLKDTHNLSEGAGSAALAALLKEKDRQRGKRVAVVLSGGNADAALISRALQG